MKHRRQTFIIKQENSNPPCPGTARCSFCSWLWSDVYRLMSFFYRETNTNPVARTIMMRIGDRHVPVDYLQQRRLEILDRQHPGEKVERRDRGLPA